MEGNNGEIRQEDSLPLNFSDNVNINQPLDQKDNLMSTSNDKLELQNNESTCDEKNNEPTEETNSIVGENGNEGKASLLNTNTESDAPQVVTKIENESTKEKVIQELIPKFQSKQAIVIKEKSYQNEKKINDNSKNFTFFDYLTGELRRNYQLENDSQRYTDRRHKFYVFISIPFVLEKFIFYGFLQCTDAFLYIFTFLPLRFLLAISHLVSYPLRMIKRLLIAGSTSSGTKNSSSRNMPLSPAEMCDLLKCIILASVTALLLFVDTSMIYHIVKSQSVIKLYIFFNMLEVADRLFSPFGQDILDSLYWTATEHKEKSRDYRLLFLLILAGIVYVLTHSGIILLQATTLNVAINSQNKALLTIMMSNNFVELKAMVFKKFEKNNLFQMSCMDVRERFHYVILLLIVIVQTLKEYNWAEGRIWVLLPDCCVVFLFEVIVDWVKHCFITKFNEIPYEVYSEYTISLAYDMASSKLKNAFSDHSDLVSRRMGFMPLPLSALLIRVVIGAVSVQNLGGVICVVLTYLCLLTLKLAMNLYLMGKACDHIDRHRQTLKAQATRHCSSLPSSRHHSMEDLTKVVQTKSTPHSPQRSLANSLDDIAAQVELLQQGMEPNPVFSSSTVSLNSLTGAAPPVLPSKVPHSLKEKPPLLSATQEQWNISPMGILTARAVKDHTRRVSLQEHSTLPFTS